MIYMYLKCWILQPYLNEGKQILKWNRISFSRERLKQFRFKNVLVVCYANLHLAKLNKLCYLFFLLLCITRANFWVFFFQAKRFFFVHVLPPFLSSSNKTGIMRYFLHHAISTRMYMIWILITAFRLESLKKKRNENGKKKKKRWKWKKKGIREKKSRYSLFLFF